jgi:hypothetical protein
MAHHMGVALLGLQLSNALLQLALQQQRREQQGMSWGLMQLVQAAPCLVQGAAAAALAVVTWRRGISWANSAMLTLPNAMPSFLQTQKHTQSLAACCWHTCTLAREGCMSCSRQQHSVSRVQQRRRQQQQQHLAQAPTGSCPLRLQLVLAGAQCTAVTQNQQPVKKLNRQLWQTS